MANERQFMAVRSGAWAKSSARDYVQGGLIAMWDGVENAGWGAHDSAAAAWRDLVGGRMIEPYGAGYAFDSDGFRISSLRTTYAECPSAEFGTLLSGGPWTIEICVISDAPRTYKNNEAAPGYITVGATPAKTVNRLLDFDIRRNETLNSYRSTGGVIQYRQSGWMTEDARVRRVNVDFSLRHSFALLASSSSSGCAFFLDGVDTTHVSPNMNQSVPSAARLGLNCNYYPDVVIATWIRWHSVRVYDRALAPDEIAANHEVDKARFWPDA